MSARPFHMGWFVGGGFSVKAWSQDWAGTNARDWATGELIIDLARSLDRACFDYVIVEDSSNVPYTHGGTSEAYLKQVMSVMKNDPAPLIPLMAQATSRIGLIPTLSVTEYPPFLLARLVNTLDHLSRGRAGWNIVTGSNDGGAQNYGMDKQIDHDTRYDMADEVGGVAAVAVRVDGGQGLVEVVLREVVAGRPGELGDVGLEVDVDVRHRPLVLDLRLLVRLAEHRVQDEHHLAVVGLAPELLQALAHVGPVLLHGFDAVDVADDRVGRPGREVPAPGRAAGLAEHRPHLG